jgi:hypothetical protein
VRAKQREVSNEQTPIHPNLLCSDSRHEFEEKAPAQVSLQRRRGEKQAVSSPLLHHTSPPKDYQESDAQTVPLTPGLDRYFGLGSLLRFGRLLEHAGLHEPLAFGLGELHFVATLERAALLADRCRGVRHGGHPPRQPVRVRQLAAL